MDNASRWTMDEDSALAYFEGEHPACEQCHERCCIRPDLCSSCEDSNIGVEAGPDKLYVHVGCKGAWDLAVAVMAVTDAVKVLRTRDGVAVTDEQAEERARNIVDAMRGCGWGPL